MACWCCLLPTSLGASGPKTKKKVIVPGAGLAGLTAAWELVQAGHEVIVIEARNRFVLHANNPRFPGSTTTVLGKQWREWFSHDRPYHCDGVYRYDGSTIKDFK
jgi:monoamine oxidase